MLKNKTLLGTVGLYLIMSISALHSMESQSAKEVCPTKEVIMEVLAAGPKEGHKFLDDNGSVWSVSYLYLPIPDGEVYNQNGRVEKIILVPKSSEITPDLKKCLYRIITGSISIRYNIRNGHIEVTQVSPEFTGSAPDGL
jgi:hypothetical protein